jgi:hypothetical protein
MLPKSSYEKQNFRTLWDQSHNLDVRISYEPYVHTEQGIVGMAAFSASGDSMTLVPFTQGMYNIILTLFKHGFLSDPPRCHELKSPKSNRHL